ncbi:S-adenosyl-L-methionine-dependent methyltransferase [Sistotremastrum suecicum HHB10207 ss-3]|uniref:S-adenosyl-L-methionine-dependent methyltransferase n=1 Tax=Sistotremastrum suecicum HHB10207 ss-3 TaxID=1314776 RepID=A0A166GV54_9AGAM|nr:S-adenosyl-L-methionine-dependent methyltransferase [Sistotremastrum suecicum HHB10207 ss-3]
MSTVHATAAAGFGTGTNELYDKARPSYPDVALSAIRDVIKGTPPFEIVELGAGTGLFTRALLAHPAFAKTIGHVRAVEPSQGMRDQFSKSVTDERVSIHDGTFEATTAESESADLVVVAQAWHWCPDYDRAIAEFARILKPNGVAVFIWNMEDRNAAGWVHQLRTAYEQHEGGTPQFRLNLWRATFSTPSYVKYFEPQEEREWTYTLPTTHEGVINRVHSKSYITQLSESDRAKVDQSLDEILKKGDGRVWIDEKEGVFEYPYKNHVVIMRKK